MVFPIESKLWVEEIIIITYRNSIIKGEPKLNKEGCIKLVFVCPYYALFIPINRVKLVGCLLL